VRLGPSIAPAILILFMIATSGGVAYVQGRRPPGLARPVRELEAPTGPVSAIAFASSGGLVALGCHTCDATVFSLESSEVVRKLGTVPDGCHTVTFAWTRQSDELVIGETDERELHPVRAWSLATATERTFNPQDLGPYVAIDPNAGRIATVSPGQITLWSARTGAFERRIDALLPGAACGVGFASRGRLVVVGSARGAIDVYDAETGEGVRTISCRRAPRFSTTLESDLVAFATADRVALYSLATGNVVAEKPEGNGAIPALSPEGERLALGSLLTGRIEILSVPELTLLDATPDAPSRVSSLAFSPDGDLLGAGFADGKARIYQLSRR
jgi:WD40 repeat protein